MTTNIQIISGECNILRELHRGRITFQKGHQECVKRRATLSLGAMKSCSVSYEKLLHAFSHLLILLNVSPNNNFHHWYNQKYCAEDVEEAFFDCYNDTNPFELHTWNARGALFFCRFPILFILTSQTIVKQIPSTREFFPFSFCRTYNRDHEVQVMRVYL